MSHRAFCELEPVLLWAHEKEVGPTLDQDVDSSFQTVWRVCSDGASAGSQRLVGLSPGDWVFLPRGRRRQRFQPGTKLWSISYRAGQPLLTGGWFDHAGAVVLRGCPALERASIRLMQRLASEAGEQIGVQARLSDLSCSHDGWLRISAEFHRWLSVVAQTLCERGILPDEEADLDPRIATVLEALRQDPWSGNCTPTGLAQLAGLSRRRLEQLFRHQIGSGIAEQRQRHCLRSAYAALEAHEHQVKKIAHQFGFASPAAFSTWFRRHAGRSPAAYRSTPTAV